jgi:putative hydroxymethylpyrimidine transport system substrate-binding protein
MESFMRRFIALLTIVLACATPVSARAGEAMTVILDWFVNPDHAPLIVALEQGYFAEAGLDVELVAPADPNDPPKLVAAGMADLAVSYQPQLYVQVHEGLPLIRVGTLIASPLNSLVVLADGPVDDIADLKGRKIGYSVGGFEDALLRTMLERHGVSLDEVELVNVNFSLSPALIAGQVDAVIGAFRNFELNQLDLEGYEGRAFYVEEEGVPPYDELILVANRETLDRSKVRRFLDALERGVLFLVNHPEESWVLFTEAYPDLDDELNRLAWRDTLPRFALSPGALDRNRYARFALYLTAMGLIDEARAVDAYALEVE